MKLRLARSRTQLQICILHSVFGSAQFSYNNEGGETREVKLPFFEVFPHRRLKIA